MSGDFRIREHPVLSVPEDASVPFTFNGEPLLARPGEMISSALFANGIRHTTTMDVGAVHKSIEGEKFNSAKTGIHCLTRGYGKSIRTDHKSLLSIQIGVKSNAIPQLSPQETVDRHTKGLTLYVPKGGFDTG